MRRALTFPVQPSFDTELLRDWTERAFAFWQILVGCCFLILSAGTTLVTDSQLAIWDEDWLWRVTFLHSAAL
jgi:hypothetical protein